MTWYQWVGITYAVLWLLTSFLLYSLLRYSQVTERWYIMVPASIAAGVLWPLLFGMYLHDLFRKR